MSQDLIISLDTSKATFESIIDALAYAEGYPVTIVEGEGVEKKRVPNTQSKEDYVKDRVKAYLNDKYVRGAKALAAHAAQRKVEAEIGDSKI